MSSEVSDAELKRLYDVEGLSLRRISALTGIPYTTLNRRLTRAGVKMRPEGTPREDTPSIRYLMQLQGQGMSIRGIARAVGRDYSTIHQRLKRKPSLGDGRNARGWSQSAAGARIPPMENLPVRTDRPYVLIELPAADPDGRLIVTGELDVEVYSGNGIVTPEQVLATIKLVLAGLTGEPVSFPNGMSAVRRKPLVVDVHIGRPEPPSGQSRPPQAPPGHRPASATSPDPQA
jgi:lambda repressor-like predicted transcriptional regulator